MKPGRANTWKLIHFWCSPDLAGLDLPPGEFESFLIKFFFTGTKTAVANLPNLHPDGKAKELRGFTVCRFDQEASP